MNKDKAYSSTAVAGGTMQAVEQYQPRLEKLLEEANHIILGKSQELKLTLCCLLAGGNILVEDIPGMGKTTLVKTFARLLGLRLNRIQFTSDLLPADILGVSVYDESEKRFVFHPGPIFSQMVLGDELNRASPKTQSACLQAMEEAEVTLDGVTYALPKPFFFVATQNPRQSVGTFALPNSQLDRFLMRVVLGYPSEEAEKELLLSTRRTRLIDAIEPVLHSQDILDIQGRIDSVYISEPLVDYLLELIRQSRRETAGLSPRAGINLLQAAKSWAFLEGRAFVIPEDIQAVAVPVMNHRLGDMETGINGWELAQSLVDRVPLD